MKKIYEYKIEPNSVKDDVYPVYIKTHFLAKPLCVMKQADSIFVWCEVETDDDENFGDKHVLNCVGTGWGSVRKENT